MAQTETGDPEAVEETRRYPCFHLECTDCSFQMTIDVGSRDALEIADQHQEEYGRTEPGHREHFVSITNDRRSEFVDG